ncbi:MAG: ABC transporter permease [Candidatus Hydrothermae bacterium]|nr:ABC transporter permease [Candidatus Hydrothermae bacterium]
MDLRSLLKTAYLGLKANKLRSLLTTLGIIIGVGTVISMVSIIEGMNKYTYKVLGSIGSKTIYVQKWKWMVSFGGGRSSKEWREIARRRDLTIEDAEAIAKLPSVELVSPEQPLFGDYKAEYRSKEVDIGSLSGVNGQYLALSGYELEEGRNFTDADMLGRRQVVILGYYQADNLFGDEDPLGKEISINNRSFYVIGVLKKRGQLLGNNLDNVVLMPVTTAQKLFTRKGSSRFNLWQSLRIVVKLRDDVSMEKGMEEIEELLRMRRGLRFDQEDDFALNTQEMLLEAYRKLTTGIFLAMIGIASLALLVGGIGIMNIMLVSVTERTREIGVRMAVGAKRREILLQFIFEAVFLTSAGGLLGVMLGFMIAKLVDLLTPLPSAMPFWSVLLGLGFSGVVGLFFGIYPASKASKMDPIVALRYE